MTAFKVDNFKGFIKNSDPRKLPPGHAQSCYGVDFRNSDLYPFNTDVNLGIVADNNLIQRSAFAFNQNQIFVFNAVVNVTYGPIRYDDDVDNRIFIDSGFQPYPVYTTKELGIPISPTSNYYGPPIAWRKLGVPAPSVTPIVVAEAPKTGNIITVGNGTVTLVDGITQVENAVIMLCSAAHNLASGDRVRMDGFNWSYYNNVFVVDLPHTSLPDADKKFVLRGVTSIDPLDHRGVDADGNEEPALAGSGTFTQEFSDLQYEDRVYLYTYVTELGEESAPSAPSELVTIGEGLGVTITTPTSPTVGDAIINTKRIYRTIPSSQGAADYYFVAEIPITQADYVDTLSHIQLGEQLQSLEWYEPPAELKGLITLPNGVMMGFKDNIIYQCEPYQPHAWPESYQKHMDNDIVGIAAFGNHVVVGTKENPYLATLNDPLSITFKKLDTIEPCLSRRAMCSLGYAVIYPSPNGLVIITPKGAKNVSKAIWKQEYWRGFWFGASAADDAFGLVHDEKYYLTLVHEGVPLNITYILDPSFSPLSVTSLQSENYTGGCVDRDEDKLFFLGQQTGPTGPTVNQHDPDTGTRVLGNWVSEVFVKPYPVNMGACQVFFDKWTLNSLSVSFYADGEYKFTQLVTTQEPFRLPSGFLAREWHIEIETDTPVQGVYVAETISELRGAFSG